MTATVQTDLQPWDWQEAHSPTEFVEVRISNQRTTQLCRRRKTDARLLDAMTAWEQDAAGMIYAGFEILTGGMGYKIQAFERKEPGQDHALERQTKLVDRYWKWAIQAQRDGLQVSATLAVLVDGLSCREIDRMRRKRKGWAAENLKESLRLYCRQRGWPTSQKTIA